MIKNHLHASAARATADPLLFTSHGTGEQLTAEIRKDWDSVLNSHIYQKATKVIQYELERDLLFYWKHLLTKLGWDFDYAELKDIATHKSAVKGATQGELSR